MKHVCFTRASVCGLCTRVQEHSRAFICIPRRMFYARVDEDSVCVDATIHSAVWRTDMHDKMQWADWIKFFVSVPYLWGGVHRSITSICSHTDSITWLRDIVTVIASVAGLVFEFDNKQQVGVWMFDCDKPHACLLVGFPQQLSLLSNRAETNKTWNTCLYVTHAPILALLRHDFPLLLVIAFLFQQNTKYANTRSVLDTGQHMRNHHRNFISSALDTGTEWRCTLSSRGTCRHTLSTPGLAGALPMYTHVNTYQTRTKDKFMCVAYECLQLVRWCIWFDVYIVQRVIWCL
jgi:hypothetical protein